MEGRRGCQPRHLFLVLLLGVVLPSLFLMELAKASPSLAPRLPGRITKRLVALTDAEALYRDTERIAIVRPPDSPGNAAVRDYIIDHFNPTNGRVTQQWNIEIDEFEDNTPHGKKRFRNIIATWNCEASERLVLAAHYDSKYFPEPRNFVAATDSAAPCALLLDIARSLDAHLSCPANLGLQLIFFDGEEAFQYWTRTDSIYGARHLAQKWANEDKLASISLFVLLDLIGAAHPTFKSYWAETDQYFGRLRAIENSLKASLNGSRGYFQSKSLSYNFVEDDHIPFLQRGVKVLHLIANPFPRVWHTDADNLSAIHLPTLADISAILRVFTAEMLGLRASSDRSTSQEEVNTDLS